MEHTSMPAAEAGAAAGAAIGAKAIGGAAAGAYGLGAALAAIVVMCMTPPRSPREWAVALISTVVGSIGGGAAAIMQLGLQAWMDTLPGLLAVLGLVFTCGLPAWAVVRWGFTWMERRRERDLAEIVSEVRRGMGP
jgi:hypothetical protein